MKVVDKRPSDQSSTVRGIAEIDQRNLDELESISSAVARLHGQGSRQGNLQTRTIQGEVVQPMMTESVGMKTTKMGNSKKQTLVVADQDLGSIIEQLDNMANVTRKPRQKRGNQELIPLPPKSQTRSKTQRRNEVPLDETGTKSTLQ
jgi:hypothetical protein